LGTFIPSNKARENRKMFNDVLLPQVMWQHGISMGLLTKMLTSTVFYWQASN